MGVFPTIKDGFGKVEILGCVIEIRECYKTPLGKKRIVEDRTVFELTVSHYRVELKHRNAPYPVRSGDPHLTFTNTVLKFLNPELVEAFILERIQYEQQCASGSGQVM